MANVPGRGAPPPPHDDRGDHGSAQHRRLRGLPGPPRQDFRSRLTDREAECNRLRQIIAVGTEQLERARQDADGWRREVLDLRAAAAGLALPPAPAGEHLQTEGALVAAQAEIIRLTQRVAAAEAETVSAENQRDALHKTNETITKNFNRASSQLYKQYADLDAERRSHANTRDLLHLQIGVPPGAAPLTRPTTTATLTAVTQQLRRPPGAPPRPHTTYTPTCSPPPTIEFLAALLAPAGAAKAAEPRPVAAAPARPSPPPPFTPSPAHGRSPVPTTSPVLGSPPSSIPGTESDSVSGSPAL